MTDKKIPKPDPRNLKPFTKTAIAQEIIVRPDGTVEIPWLTPGATDLVVALGRLLNRGEGFAVGVVSGNIYCG